MIQWKIDITNHFKKTKNWTDAIRCSTHGETTVLEDAVSQKKYKVQLKSRGVCLHDFDELTVNTIERTACFDVLSISETAIKYIELKSSITTKIMKEVGKKFCCGHRKAQEIIKLLPIQNCSQEYIIICTKDVFTKMETEDVLQKKARNVNKEYIDAWEKNQILLETPDSEIDPDATGIIPITKHVYNEQTIQWG